MSSRSARLLVTTLRSWRAHTDFFFPFKVNPVGIQLTNRTNHLSSTVLRVLTNEDVEDVTISPVKTQTQFPWSLKFPSCPFAVIPILTPSPRQPLGLGIIKD